MNGICTRIILPAASLLWREIIRFYRQPNRVVGALLTPLVFWFIIGSGFYSSLKLTDGQGTNSLQFLYPGSMVLIILFTSIFSTISIIEDRREGFLQSVLVAPVSRTGLVIGKLLGGTLLSLLQALVFLVLSPLLGINPGLSGYLAAIVYLFLISFALTGLGFILAWRMDSTQGFHALMNLFLMPLWMLSGSFFPAEGAAGWLAIVMKWNPLSYGVSGLRSCLTGNEFIRGTSGLEMGITIAFALVMCGGAAYSARRTTQGDLL